MARSSSRPACSSLRHGHTSPHVQNCGPAAPSAARTATRRCAAKNTPTQPRVYRATASSRLATLKV
ncbi:hypothetical protein ACFQ9X_02195 [Catenulispora yoronensis]